jgi:Protein of unknown function (DUF3037)
VYDFSLLRFVPDPAREEFINVGVIAGDGDAGDWDLRILSNLRRAKAIDSAGLLPTAMAFIAELDERLPGDEADAPALALDELRELSAHMNNVLQITAPRRVVASDAAEALDIVCRDLLLDPATSLSHRYRNARTAIGAASRAYRQAQLPEDSVRRAVAVAAGRTRGTFDFVVHNGHAVQLAKCYSFELPDQASLTHDVMAWAWLAHEVRERGATVTAKDGEELEAPADLSIACIYVPPRDGEETSAFEQATEVFQEIDVKAASIDDAGAVARIAAQLAVAR